MCGIHLILDKKGGLDEQAIQGMLASMHHRGPDHHHFYRQKQDNLQLFIGHNRLKIIDLSDQANQPFISHDRRYILSFNGEIYNYTALRKKLFDHYPFKTQSDTEVLLYWLIDHQISHPRLPSQHLSSAFQALEGMYSFIFYDTYYKTLILARDALGIKPLFYFESEDYLIASSEIKGILASGLVRKTLNESQIFPYLQYRFAQKPQTFFKNIFQIESPKIWQIPSTSAMKSQEIKHFVPQPDNSKPISQHKVLSSLKDTWFSSLRAQIRADVPFGIFLSGGVDSTLMLASLKELGYAAIPTFSVGYAHSSFGTEDAHFARLAAKMYKAQHHEIEVGIEDISEIENIVQYLDQPIGDAAVWLTYHLSKFASSQVRVILSGAGADELFAGYNRHWAFHQYLKYRSFFSFLPILKKIPHFPEGKSHPWRKYFRLFNRFVHQLDARSPSQTFLNFTKLDSDQLFSRGQLEAGGQNNWPALSDKNSLWLEAALKYDRHHFLSEDVLALSDQMSMQHSLEIRVPYLDPKMTSWIDQVNPEIILAQGQKWLLKSLLQKQGGAIFTQRKKEGFGMPFGQWFKNPKAQAWQAQLKNPQSLLWEFIDYSKVQRILNLHLNHHRDFSSEIWAILLLSWWLKHHFD